MRWLLQPPELRELRKVDTPSQALAFIERFWLRRDPDPGTPGNGYRDAFYRRVEAADQLYGESARRGSLTDRGRALILLGSPSGLKVTSRPGLRWNPRREGRDKISHRDVKVEIWSYRRDHLPRVLGDAMAAMGYEEEIALLFRIEPERARLTDGEDILDLAARVALARPQ